MEKSKIHELKKFLAKALFKSGMPIKDIAHELSITQKEVKELLKK